MFPKVEPSPPFSGSVPGIIYGRRGRLMPVLRFHCAPRLASATASDAGFIDSATYADIQFAVANSARLS